MVGKLIEQKTVCCDETQRWDRSQRRLEGRIPNRAIFRQMRGKKPPTPSIIAGCLLCDLCGVRRTAYSCATCIDHMCV